MSTFEFASQALPVISSTTLITTTFLASLFHVNHFFLDQEDEDKHKVVKAYSWFLFSFVRSPFGNNKSDKGLKQKKRSFEICIPELLE